MKLSTNMTVVFQSAGFFRHRPHEQVQDKRQVDSICFRLLMNGSTPQSSNWGLSQLSLDERRDSTAYDVQKKYGIYVYEVCVCSPLSDLPLTYFSSFFALCPSAVGSTIGAWFYSGATVACSTSGSGALETILMVMDPNKRWFELNMY